MAEFRPSILVLDEDLLALELYSRELAEPYRVTLCARVQEARDQLAQADFDFFIVEPAVEGGEGWSLLNELPSRRRRPLVVVCSVEDERKTVLEKGADAFLVKPVLMPVLHNLLDQLSAQKSIQTSKERKKVHD